MSEKLLINFLKGIHPASEEVLADYASRWKPYSSRKKSIITSPGETEKYLYFVIEGIQKSYLLNKEKQHVIAFAYPPSLSGVIDSFFTQSPSFHFLETITDSSFLRVPYYLHAEYMEDRELGTLFRKLSEKFLRGVIQRQQELLALDMESRYRIFASRSSHLINQISQKDLASYLGIDPTNFSKLLNSVRI